MYTREGNVSGISTRFRGIFHHQNARHRLYSRPVSVHHDRATAIREARFGTGGTYNSHLPVGTVMSLPGAPEAIVQHGNASVVGSR